MLRRVVDNPLLEAAIAVLLLGCIPIIIKSISANAITIGLFRLTTGILFLAIWLKGKKYFLDLKRKDWAVLMLIGIIFGIHWLTYFFSIKISSVSMAVIGLSSYGVHLILLSSMFRVTKVQPSDILAVILAIIGNLLVVPDYSLKNDATLGLVLGIVSGFLYACLPLIHQRHSHIPSTIRTFGQFLFAFALFIIFLPNANIPSTGLDWIGLLFLGIFGTVFTHTLWVRVTTVLSTNTTSVVYYGYLPVAIKLDYFVLGGEITLRMLCGAILIVVASICGVLHQLKNNTVMAQNLR